MPRYYKPEYQGDSRPETQKHIDLVNENGKKFCDKFLERLTHHDASKLEEPERKYFDKGTPQLKNSTYGDKSYDDAKERIKPGLEHHYAENDHHPEHFGKKLGNSFPLAGVGESKRMTAGMYYHIQVMPG